MAKRLKVYGGNFHLRGKQVRGIIAGTQKQAAESTGGSVNHIREYWSETGNARELEIALAEPGVLFWCPTSHKGTDEYKRVEPEKPKPADDYTDDNDPNIEREARERDIERAIEEQGDCEE